MSIQFEVYPDLHIVLTILTGTVDDQMCLDNIHKLAASPGFDASFDQVIDVTGITANKITNAGLTAVAELTPFSSASRRAFIISESNIVTQAGFFGSLSGVESDNIFVTHDRDKAYDWLLKK